VALTVAALVGPASACAVNAGAAAKCAFDEAGRAWFRALPELVR
jgi:hypothetical protein